ncbi:hypothetical protein TWF481_009384 [Arthrobotrys musiformis]|uniref:Uncharacterized protein n=1 Tax=Arthrobotrys musiformis TaxID=47236 RepID=A0AAV9W3F8_9PEZI
MYLSIWTGLFLDATDGEYLWVVKWSLLNGQSRSFTLKEIRRILDGDGGLQAFKNLFTGPWRARFLSLYVVFVRIGPRLGLAFLASAYEIFVGPYGLAYERGFSWGYLIGGFVLLIGIQSVVILTSVLCIRAGYIIPPNTALGISMALRPCIRPLGDSGGNADASSIIEALEEENPARYSLGVVTIQDVPVAQFNLHAFHQDPVPTSEKLQKLQKTTKLSYSSTNLVTGPMFSCICSLLLVTGTYLFMKRADISGSGDLGRYLGVNGLGTLNNKFSLAILLQFCSLFIGAFTDEIIHIIRWSCMGNSKNDIKYISTLLSGKNLWNHWNLPGCAALLNFYDVIGGEVTADWKTIGTSAIWISFGIVVAVWIFAAGGLACGMLIPKENSLSKAHAFRRVVEEIERTGSTGSIVMYGRVASAPTGQLATAVSSNAEHFVPGTYL